MAHVSKRIKAQRAKLDTAKAYPVDEALQILKTTASVKFDESVDIAINLGIDAKKSDQNVRGTAVMPRGTGKKVRIAVFAEGAAAEAAKQAGADIIGFQDLADRIKQGQLDFENIDRKLKAAFCPRDQEWRPSRPTRRDHVQDRESAPRPRVR